MFLIFVFLVEVKDGGDLSKLISRRITEIFFFFFFMVGTIFYGDAYSTSLLSHILKPYDSY